MDTCTRLRIGQENETPDRHRPDDRDGMNPTIMLGAEQKLVKIEVLVTTQARSKGHNRGARLLRQPE